MKKVLILILALMLSSCVQETSQLDSVEVKEYQGEKLSSVKDFRENSIKGPQYINKDTYRLEITGLVNNPKEYPYQELIDNFQSYEKVVTLQCVEGWSAKILWEGFLVKDLLAEINPKEEANTVILYAYDGYSTSFPIEYFEDDIIIAYHMNGAELLPERGFPLQLVAESKWGYKWIKWITKIELSTDSTYRGYWEKRGYSNTGNLDEGFLE